MREVYWTAKFPFGFQECPLGSAVPRETHRQVVLFPGSWRGVYAPFSYLLNRNRKLGTSQDAILDTSHLQEENILETSIRRLAQEDSPTSVTSNFRPVNSPEISDKLFPPSPFMGVVPVPGELIERLADRASRSPVKGRGVQL